MPTRNRYEPCGDTVVAVKWMSLNVLVDSMSCGQCEFVIVCAQCRLTQRQHICIPSSMPSTMS